MENAKENPDKTAIDFLNNFLINPALVTSNYTKNKFKDELENSADGINEIEEFYNEYTYNQALETTDLAFNPAFDENVTAPLDASIDDASEKTTKELNESFKKYLDKKEYVKFNKENNIDIMTIGFEVRDRYESRNIFSRWFTRDGWRERSIINNLRKAFEQKGVGEDKYDEIFLESNKLRKESIIKATALVNYKDEINKFNNLKNEINNSKNLKENIKDIKKLDCFINMGLVNEDDIEQLKTIKKESIDLLVEKGANKKEIYNDFGLTIDVENFPVDDIVFGKTYVDSNEISNDDLTISTVKVNDDLEIQ